MESQIARLEREAEETRWQISATLEELRDRVTPGHVVDQVIDYTRDSPAAEFLRNLGREVRENPLPLVLIGVGIAWLLVASSRTSRAVIASADEAVRKAEGIGTATSAVATRAGDRGQQTASDRASDMANTVGHRSAELADRLRDATDSLAAKSRSASAVAKFERAKRPFTGTSNEAAEAVSSNAAAVSSTPSKKDAVAAEPGL